MTCVHSVRRRSGPVPHSGRAINALCPFLQPAEPPCLVEGAWVAAIESEALVAAPDQAACLASCAVKSDCLLAYWKDATQECYHTINARCASERQKSELFRGGQGGRVGCPCTCAMQWWASACSSRHMWQRTLRRVGKGCAAEVLNALTLPE